MVENLWYSEVTNEVVDDGSTEEQNIIDTINQSLDESNRLGENKLEELNQDQLASFLAKNYFSDGVKSYAEYRKTWKILNFSMKAALQLLSKWDQSKYDDKWNETTDENGKTIDELIWSKWGIDLDDDPTLIKILQRKVWAEPDGKPGPQTIASVISALGGDVSNFYEWINTLYSKNEKFQIKNVAEFTIWWTNYKYDKNQITIWKEGDKTKITYKGNIKEVDTTKNPPVCEWFTFENGWIKKSNTKTDQSWEGWNTGNNTGNKESTNNTNDIENDEKINSDLYNTLVNEIRTILNNYTVTTCVANWWYSWWPDFNPMFQVSKNTGNGRCVSHKFNLHNFITENGKKLDKEKLKTSIESEMNKLVKEDVEKINKGKDENNFISSIRWKTYTAQEIFWNEYDKDDLALKAFLAKFKDNKIEIDKDSKIVWETLHLEFDITWINKKSPRTKQEIGLDKIRNWSWKIDTTLFKKELAKTITKIVNDVFSA